MYNYQRETACKYFRDQLMDVASGNTENFGDDSDPGWKEDLPWLYYENTARTTLRTRRRFDMR